MWHFESNGEAAGPVSEETIVDLAKRGEISRDTKVWREGMSRWSPLRDTPLDQIVFGSPPLAEPSLTDGLEPAQPADALAEDGDKASPPSDVKPAQPLMQIAKHASVAIWAYVAVSVLYIISDLVTVGFLAHIKSGAANDDLAEQAALVDGFAGAAGLLHVAIYIWSAVVIGRWMFFAMRNLRALGVQTSISPGWAVGWFFVPIANLWKPYQAMAQIWRGSHGENDANAGPVYQIVGWWWAAWLVSGFALTTATRMSLRADASIDSLMASHVLAAVGLGISIGSAVLILLIIKRVAWAQSSVFANN